MASPGKRESTSLIQKLINEPYYFDFFQAVRLLEWVARRRSQDDSAGSPHPVGYDGPIDNEVVRFKTLQSHTFPSSSLCELRMPADQQERADSVSPPDLVTTFMGLTGPSGVLPHHYTTLIIERLRAKDYSLADFFDLFNHRAISLFHRAWEKYRFAIGYERLKFGDASRIRDDFTQALYSLVGLGTDRVRGRLNVDDEAFLFFGGHFAHVPRSAIALESILTDYFNLTVDIEQFLGQWLYLERDQQSQLPNRRFPQGLNCAIGKNTVVGERVWSVECKFRLRIGPLDYEQFLHFMPNGDVLQTLCQIVRTYVGLEYDFDVQLTLKPQAVPWCRLDSNSTTDAARLGWNTWIRCRDFEENVEDTIFRHEGLPSNTFSKISHTA